VAGDQGTYDFILADLEQDQRTPAWLLADGFLRRSHARLADGGCLLLNLIIEQGGQPVDALHRIRRACGDETLLVHLPDYDNLLVLVFAGAAPAPPTTASLQRQSLRWGIDFAAMADRMHWIRPTLR
jgi:spermidine synthase